MVFNKHTGKINLEFWKERFGNSVYDTMAIKKRTIEYNS